MRAALGKKTRKSNVATSSIATARNDARGGDDAPSKRRRNVVELVEVVDNDEEDEQNDDEKPTKMTTSEEDEEAFARLRRLPSHEDVKRVQSSLLHWYRANKRDFPWRSSSTTPYGIWISEVMAQQTQVGTVAKYWSRWMERFPTVERLASSTPDEVNEIWAGLGYYTRARNLHAGAREVVERYAGNLPRTSRELREISGIGEYTAAAIASIAFGERVAAVDGNVLRVVSRLAAAGVDIKQGRARREIATFAAALVRDVEDPGGFNQAIMELGATVCTPRAPSCSQCPLREKCLGWAEVRSLIQGSRSNSSTSASEAVPETSSSSSQSSSVDKKPTRDAIGVEIANRYPGKPLAKKKPSPRTSVLTVVVKRRSDGAVLATRRPADGLLANTWELVGTEWRMGATTRDENPCEALRRRLREIGFCEMCVASRDISAFSTRGSFSHVFSHRIHDVEWGTVELDLGDSSSSSSTTTWTCCERGGSSSSSSPPAVKWIASDKLYHSGLTRVSTKVLDMWLGEVV